MSDHMTNVTDSEWVLVYPASEAQTDVICQCINYFDCWVQASTKQPHTTDFNGTAVRYGTPNHRATLQPGEALWARAIRQDVTLLTQEAQGVDVSGSGFGWAYYKDTALTEENVLKPPTNTWVDLPNDAGATIETFLPEFMTGAYDGTKINATEGWMMAITMDFTYRPLGSSYQPVFFGIDIGGTQGLIRETSKVMPKGRNVARRDTVVIPVFNLDTFAANGGVLKYKTIGSGELYDVGMLLQIHGSP
jgi:hypothetical protein